MKVRVKKTNKKDFILDLKPYDMSEILTSRPPKRKKTSEKQEDNESHFRQATCYAKWAATDPESKAAYEKAVTPGKNGVFHVALRDYLKAPVIHYIKVENYKGKAGERITIKATDDFRVEKVIIHIISGDGKRLENGKATRVRLKPDFWHYDTTIDNPVIAGTVIRVYACDRPGNETEGEWRVPDQ